MSSQSSRGSSPLVRGGLDRLQQPRLSGRLIPARAGRTNGHPRSTRWPPAHPRSCGADRVGEQATQVETGSSPLVRGGRSTCGTASGCPTAHPRSCGADGHWGEAANLRCGSSPLVRGGPAPRRPRRLRRRLIPARAGRTPVRRPASAPRSAHPRSCGADEAGSTGSRRRSGSSPLVRGGLDRLPEEGANRRLIPARAGRTRRLPPRLPGRPAHPRSCGADSSPVSPWLTGGGSSPLVRGGLASALLPVLMQRLIPARAGRTSTPEEGARVEPAHPRSCGADAVKFGMDSIEAGSSPLVRGGHCSPRMRSDSPRLIPARAGRTPPGNPPPSAPTAHPRSCGADSTTV